MKILVCISHVPDTTSKINFVDDDTVFDKNGVKFVINPNDEFGLTRAVWFQQKQQAEMEQMQLQQAQQVAESAGKVAPALKVLNEQ